MVQLPPSLRPAVNVATTSRSWLPPHPTVRGAHLALLLLVALPLLFVRLDLPLLDPDEGLYATAAQEMLGRGDWVVPHVNGLPYLERPPLYFWLTALTLRVFGPSEWSVRLWSALATLGSVLLAWRIGVRLYGERAGLLAGLVLATVVGNTLYVRKASTDQLFVFCLTLAMYGFLRDVDGPRRGGGRFLLAYLGAALAVLAKGFLGLVFPVLIAGIGMALARRLTLRDLNLARGALLFALVAVPWHVLVAWRSWTLFRFYALDNHVYRFFNAHFVEDDVPISTLGFLIATFVWAFPWSVFVLGRPRAPVAPDTASRRLTVVAWVLVIVGFFALSRFKHEYYALPAFPALALLVGAAWDGGRDIGRWLGVGMLGCGVVGLGALWVGAGLTADQALAGLGELNAYYRILREQGEPFPFASPRPFGLLLQALGLTLVVGWGVAALVWARGWRRGAFATLIGMATMISVLILQLLTVVEPHHSTREISRAISARAGPADAIVIEGSLDYSPGILFYTERRVLLVNGDVGYFAFASRLPGASGVFLDTAGLARLWEGAERVFLVVRQPRERSVVGTLPPGRVVELGRYGSRWLYSNRGS